MYQFLLWYYQVGFFLKISVLIQNNFALEALGQQVTCKLQKEYIFWVPIYLKTQYYLFLAPFWSSLHINSCSVSRIAEMFLKLLLAACIKNRNSRFSSLFLILLYQMFFSLCFFLTSIHCFPVSTCCTYRSTLSSLLSAC